MIRRWTRPIVPRSRPDEGRPPWVRLARVALLLLVGLAATAAGHQRPAQAGETRTLRVAAAADLRVVFADIAAAFEQQNPDVKVEVTYGSSGNFYSQLSSRAPFDLFLSADLDYPRRLVEQGLSVPNSEFSYAVGALVLWVPKASPIAVEKGIEALLDPSARKIAIANPRHAPYGRAAEAAIADAVKDERVKQTCRVAKTRAGSLSRRCTAVAALALPASEIACASPA